MRTKIFATSRMQGIAAKTGGPLENNPSDIVRAEFRKYLFKGYQKDIDDIPISELGVDSLAFMEIVIRLDEDFGIVIPIDKLDNEVTVRDIIGFLEG